MKKRLLSSTLILSFMLSLTVHASSTANSIYDFQIHADQDVTTSQAASMNALNEIYKTDSLNYAVYESRLLDTYFIACSLYFDFSSMNLLPDTDKHALYSDAKAYFEKYKEHPFIQNLGNYVDQQNKAERGGVVYPLLMYSFSMQDYHMGIGTLQTDVFQNAEEFQVFLDALQRFYTDTNADEFFQRAEAQKAMNTYLKEELPKSSIHELLSEMEHYTGNKTDLYGNHEIRYRSVTTLFRPFHASFYTFHTNDATYFIGQLSPTTSEKNPEMYDIGQFVETSIHEFLHNYINQPVYEQNDSIQNLAKDRNKADYAGTNAMYQTMDWHRIVDENIVRAVETAIYANVYHDRAQAYEQVMKKEVEFGGMLGLPRLYEALETYEKNRDLYASIADYLPMLIDSLFEA